MDAVTAKTILDTENKVNSAQVELDFYSTPFPYKSVEPKSANHLFGNGKWKKTCLDAFGRDVFDKYADRYEGRTIDFQLVSLVTDQANYFQPNEKIKVTGDYNFEGKVLVVENKRNVIIMAPFTENGHGKIINVTRKEGAQKAFDRFSQMLSDLKPTVPGTPKAEEKPIISNAVDQPIPTPITPTKTNYNKLIITAILATAAIFILIKIIKKK